MHETGAFQDRFTAARRPVTKVIAGWSTMSALLIGLTTAWASAQSPPSEQTGSNVIAIDILIEPDATLIDRANAVNARLRQVYPQGYALDSTHSPHITLVQRFVRVSDIATIGAAIENVLTAERLSAMPFRATGYEFVEWAGVGVNVIVVERSPRLLALQQRIVDVVQPFAVSGGTAAAFAAAPGDGPINEETIGWVEHFVPGSSGDKYLPHVTVGVAPMEYLKALKAEPFDEFTFSASGVAIYQLGNFGTAQKKLWSAGQ